MTVQEGAGDAGNQERVVLSGWRLHPTASRILLALMIGGLVGISWLPGEWEITRLFCFYMTAFTAGIQAARLAAIWQKADESAES